jgi:hypothetical protein
MVDLLWKDGLHHASARLEDLWDDLGQKATFSLLCGYQMNNFDLPEHGERFEQICRSHTRVAPTELYPSRASIEIRLREIAVLQQRAHALGAEIKRRKHDLAVTKGSKR